MIWPWLLEHALRYIFASYCPGDIYGQVITIYKVIIVDIRQIKQDKRQRVVKMAFIKKREHFSKHIIVTLVKIGHLCYWPPYIISLSGKKSTNDKLLLRVLLFSFFFFFFFFVFFFCCCCCRLFFFFFFFFFFFLSEKKWLTFYESCHLICMKC